MGERVNLQYTIELDELGTEVSRLLEAAHTQLSTVIVPQPNSESEALSLDTLENVDDIRQRLAKLDYCLRDINNIIGAYINYRTALSQEGESDSPHEDTVVDESTPQE
jgi:hypothetical protein